MWWILPKSIIRAIGIFLGYLFNFLIVGGFLYMTLKSVINRDGSSAFGGAVFTLATGAWLVYLIKTTKRP